MMDGAVDQFAMTVAEWVVRALWGFGIFQGVVVEWPGRLRRSPRHTLPNVAFHPLIHLKDGR